MYAVNITGEIDEMLRRHDQRGGRRRHLRHGEPEQRRAARRGGAAAPFRAAIHGHRNGWGMYGRSPSLGMSFIAWQKLWRLAGVDHMHVNGIANKFCEPDESVIASARECLKPMFDEPGNGCEIMPVFSSGQTARQAPATYRALGTTDLIFAAGGGIMAHPGGIAAGVRSLQQAWAGGGGGNSARRVRRHARRTARRARRSSSRDGARSRSDKPIFSFYGDDFTGSTDALEALAAQRRARRAVPAPARRGRISAAFAGCRAVGIAGDSRSRSPEWMRDALPAGLRALAPRSARRWCSTRSAPPSTARPKTGSIGCALEIGAGDHSAFPRCRWCRRRPYWADTWCSAHLFAAGGRRNPPHRPPSGHERATPSPPMAESDLLLHLARQTGRKLALMDIVSLRAADRDARFERLAPGAPDAILFDGLEDGSLATERRGSSASRRSTPQVFVVGSSGFTYGMMDFWRAQGWLPEAAGAAPARAGCVRTPAGAGRKLFAAHRAADPPRAARWFPWHPAQSLRAGRLGGRRPGGGTAGRGTERHPLQRAGSRGPPAKSTTARARRAPWEGSCASRPRLRRAARA